MKNTTAHENSALIVDMKDIDKNFNEVCALSGVDFGIREGEIRAVIGENGAGKSTLMNILYGLCSYDKGSINLRGKPIGDNWSPSQAIASGIGMIQQHFSSIFVYSVLENIMLPVLKWNALNDRWREEQEKIEKIVDEYGFEVQLQEKYGNLSIGQKQQVEIIKVLNQGVDILILDEPTSVLTPAQAKALLDLLLKIRDRGISIIIVTHKLEEVIEVCDSATVLRGGRLVATVEKDKSDIQKLARMMIGRDYYSETEPPHSLKEPHPVMTVDHLSYQAEDTGISVHDCSFQLNKGEILGIAGVSGNGQNELAQLLFGMETGCTGQINLNGKEIKNSSIAERLQMGLGFIPEDRHEEALVLPMNVAENLVMSRIDSKEFTKHYFLQKENINVFSRQAITEFNILTQNEHTPAAQLSGGNQQKVVLARVLKSKPKVIIACQPTWGLDFGATEYIRCELEKVAVEGASVLLISNDLDEILELSHRILVMYKGSIVGSFLREEVDMDELSLLMAGKTA